MVIYGFRGNFGSSTHLRCLSPPALAKKPKMLLDAENRHSLTSVFKRVLGCIVRATDSSLLGCSLRGPLHRPNGVAVSSVLKIDGDVGDAIEVPFGGVARHGRGVPFGGVAGHELNSGQSGLAK